jgi:cytochrome c
MDNRISVLALLAALVAAPAFAQDGQMAFNNSCRTCHTVKQGDNRLGPSLAGVVGRKAGTAEGYPFSSALKQSGIVWDEANLDAFIEDPEKAAPGNGMKPYGGIADPAQRKAIVEFLKQSG